ncbi:hypothetical protein ACI093_001578 [Cronobacter turicensis]
MRSSEKIKWSRVRTSLSLEDLSRYLKNGSVNESGRGYSDVEVGNGFCTAVYNERIHNSIVSLDYYGNEFEQEVIEFYSVRFEIIHLVGNAFVLSLINPPKTLKPFIDFLTEGLNYKVGISGVELDVRLFLEQLASNEQVSLLKVKKVKVNSVIISDAAKATIEMTSSKNAIDELSILLGQKDFSVDKIKISCLINNSQTEMELSKNGIFSSRPEAMGLIKQLLFPQLVHWM